MRYLVASLGAFALGACVAAQPKPLTDPGIPFKMTAAEVQNVQKGVRDALKDPESARFKPDVQAARAPNGDVTACGIVNAKNSFGGYVGDRPFIAIMKVGKPIDVATASSDTVGIILQMCREAGVQV